jgi:hypothetical protein
VFQNLENPAATCDEDAILWGGGGEEIHSCNNFYIGHVSLPVLLSTDKFQLQLFHFMAGPYPQ